MLYPLTLQYGRISSRELSLELSTTEMATILFIVKFASMATAGVLGLSGLVHSYKDENGKLTKIGRWAFAGILTSSLLSIVILGLEQYQAVSSATESAKSLAESAKRQEEISSKLEKTLRSQEENLTTTKQVASGMERSLSDQQKLLEGSSNTLNTTESILLRQNNSLTQQGQLLSKQELMLNNLTGADSYCYALVGFLDEDLILLMMFNRGDYPIYDVVVEIIDQDNETDIRTLSGKALWDFINQNKTRHTFQAIGPKAGIQLNTVNLKGLTSKKLHINFYTRYKSFSEDIRLVKINQNWTFAYRVFASPRQIKNGQPPEVLLKSEVGEGFPVNKDKKVDW